MQEEVLSSPEEEVIEDAIIEETVAETPPVEEEPAPLDVNVAEEPIGTTEHIG
jgi:hypothetical protein